MTGTTAQLVALVCHLNATSSIAPTDSFLEKNSTCKFCEYVHFLRRQRGWLSRGIAWRIVAKTPEQWLTLERRKKCRAYLVHQRNDNVELPDRMSAAFIGGGGSWRIALVHDRQMDLWEPR